jgi:hypothetical protein
MVLRCFSPQSEDIIGKLAKLASLRLGKKFHLTVRRKQRQTDLTSPLRDISLDGKKATPNWLLILLHQFLHLLPPFRSKKLQLLSPYPPSTPNIFNFWSPSALHLSAFQLHARRFSQAPFSSTHIYP